MPIEEVTDMNKVYSPGMKVVISSKSQIESIIKSLSEEEKDATAMMESLPLSNVPAKIVAWDCDCDGCNEKRAIGGHFSVVPEVSGAVLLSFFFAEGGLIAGTDPKKRSLMINIVPLMQGTEVVLPSYLLTPQFSG